MIVDRKTTTVLSSDRPAQGGQPSSLCPPQLYPSNPSIRLSCTHLDEGTCHPASQMLEGKVLLSSLAAQGWFRLGGKEKLPGSTWDGEQDPPLPQGGDTPVPAQMLGSQRSTVYRLTLGRRCVGPPHPGTASWPGRLRAQHGTGGDGLARKAQRTVGAA